MRDSTAVPRASRRSDVIGLISLLRHHVPRWRNGRFRRFLRNRERQPIFHSDGRFAAPSSPYPFRFRYPCTDVVGDLLISIADKTDKDLFREKHRRTPIEMEIGTALNLRIWILEVVRKAGDA
jgi:hypothetical protein